MGSGSSSQAKSSQKTRPAGSSAESPAQGSAPLQGQQAGAEPRRAQPRGASYARVNRQDAQSAEIHAIIRNLSLGEIVYSALISSTPEDANDVLQALVSLTQQQEQELGKSISDAILDKLRTTVHSRLESRSSNIAGTTAAPSATTISSDSKFADLPQARFLKLESFLDGLDGYIGLPSPKTFQAMRQEHCTSPDSNDIFKTSNYGGTETTPKLEWECVVNPDLTRQYPGQRTPANMAIFLDHETSVKAKLSKEEVVALRLYTGPMFVKYNAVLRAFPASTVEALKGNKYVTTLHAICSGITKVARVSSIPPNRRVFRGLAGVRLPEDFEIPDEYGLRGGVEAAFMSTTANLEVAMSYVGSGKLPFIFQIDVGQVDRGASIKYLSQYPHEDEILFPPLSNLEVMADPHEEETHMGLVTILPLRVNANVKSLTINQLKDRRKTLHVEMLKDLVNETRVALQDHSLHLFDAMDADRDGFVDSKELSALLHGYGGTFVQKGLEAMGADRVDKASFRATVQPVLEGYMRDCRDDAEYVIDKLEGILEHAKTLDADKLNEDAEYRRHLNEAMEGKSFAENVYRLFRQCKEEEYRYSRVGLVKQKRAYDVSMASLCQILSGDTNPSNISQWEHLIHGVVRRFPREGTCWDAALVLQCLYTSSGAGNTKIQMRREDEFDQHGREREEQFELVDAGAVVAKLQELRNNTQVETLDFTEPWQRGADFAKLCAPQLAIMTKLKSITFGAGREDASLVIDIDALKNATWVRSTETTSSKRRSQSVGGLEQVAFSKVAGKYVRSRGVWNVLAIASVLQGSTVLERLDLEGEDWGVCASLELFLPRMTSLKELRAGNAYHMSTKQAKMTTIASIGDPGMLVLKRCLVKLTQLHSLHLGGCGIGGSGGRMLAECLSVLTLLQTLDLRFCRLCDGNERAEELGGAMRHLAGSLVSLDLTCNSIGRGSGGECLCRGLSMLTALQTLHLEGNFVERFVGGHLVRSLRAMTSSLAHSLQHLHLPPVPMYYKAVDSVFVYPPGLGPPAYHNRAFLLSGAAYCTWDLSTHTLEQGPKPISELFPSLPFLCIDAILNWPECGPPENHNIAFIFCGEYFVRWDLRTNELQSERPVPIAQGWPGYPFRTISSVFMFPPGVGPSYAVNMAYMMYKDVYWKWNLATNNGEQHTRSIKEGWDERLYHIDAVLPVPPGVGQYHEGCAYIFFDDLVWTWRLQDDSLMVDARDIAEVFPKYQVRTTEPLKVLPGVDTHVSQSLDCFFIPEQDTVPEQRKGIAYMFSQDSVVEWDLATDTARGSPRPISEVFPGVPYSRIEGIVVYPRNVGPTYCQGFAYIFSGETYVKWSLSGDQMTQGENAIARGWPGVPFPSVSASFIFPDGQGPVSDIGAAYLFYQDKFCVWNTREDKLLQGAMLIKDAFPGYPFPAVDSVICFPPGEGPEGSADVAYFCYNDSYVVWDLTENRPLDGVPLGKIEDTFPGYCG